MTSIEMINTLPLDKLLAIMSACNAALVARAGGAVLPLPLAAGGKVKKVKEEPKGPKVKRVTQGSAWADFTKMICSERAEAYAAFKEASEVKQGIAPRFVASYRSEHEAEWDTFQADWNAKHPKLSKEEKAASAAASVASEEEEIASVTSEEVKKRKGPKKLSEMTAEELAAHKARVAAKQAAKAAPTVEEVEAKAAAPFVLAPAPAPAPAAEAPAAEVAEAPAAEVAEAEAEEEASLEPRTFTSGGQKYIRLWNTDTESWASGHLWLPKKKGTSLTYGSYVGELMVDGSINPDSDEPEMP